MASTESTTPTEGAPKATINWDPVEMYERLLYGFAAVSAIFFISGGYIFYNSWSRYGLTLFSLSLIGGALSYMGFKRQKKVPANPSHVAVMTWWNRRSTKRLLPASDYFDSNFFPFQTGILPVSMEKKTNNFTVNCPTILKDDATTQRTRPASTALLSGGAVIATSQLVWIPNASEPKSMFEYIDSGIPTEEKGKDPMGGVVNRLYGRISAVQREAIGRMSWQEALFMKERATAIVIRSLTGEKIPRYRRDISGLLLNSVNVVDPVEIPNKTHEIGEWTVVDLANCVSDDLENMKRDVHHYIADVNARDTADIHGFGIIIKEYNVEGIVGAGKLGQVADAAAIEQAEGSKQRVEQSYRLEAATAIVAASKEADPTKPISLNEAYRILRIEEGKSKESIYRGVLEADGMEGLAKFASAFEPFAERIIKALEKKEKKE